MTNYEMLLKNSKTPEELGLFLCDMFTLRSFIEENEIEICDICPVKDLCSPTENGMVAILKSKSQKIDWTEKKND